MAGAADARAPFGLFPRGPRDLAVDTAVDELGRRSLMPARPAPRCRPPRASPGRGSRPGVRGAARRWLGGGGALAIAVLCALAAEDDARTVLLAAVSHSGDSDSTGALRGNILGAAHGDGALPQDWPAGVEARDVLLPLADDVYAVVADSDGLRGAVTDVADLPRSRVDGDRGGA